MSIESAKAFYNRLTTDEVLKTKLQNADSNEKFLALVASAGYSFTRKEWDTVLVSVSMMSGTQSIECHSYRNNFLGTLGFVSKSPR